MSQKQTDIFANGVMLSKGLVKDIETQLNEMPAKDVRGILNRFESEIQQFSMNKRREQEGALKKAEEIRNRNKVEPSKSIPTT